MLILTRVHLTLNKAHQRVPTLHIGGLGPGKDVLGSKNSDESKFEVKTLLSSFRKVVWNILILIRAHLTLINAHQVVSRLHRGPLGQEMDVLGSKNSDESKCEVKTLFSSYQKLLSNMLILIRAHLTQNKAHQLLPTLHRGALRPGKDVFGSENSDESKFEVKTLLSSFRKVVWNILILIRAHLTLINAHQVVSRLHRGPLGHEINVLESKNSDES